MKNVALPLLRNQVEHTIDVQFDGFHFLGILQLNSYMGRKSDDWVIRLMDPPCISSVGSRLYEILLTTVRIDGLNV